MAPKCLDPLCIQRRAHCICSHLSALVCSSLIPGRRMGVCGDQWAHYSLRLAHHPCHFSPACHRTLCQKWGWHLGGLVPPEPLSILDPAGKTQCPLILPSGGQRDLGGALDWEAGNLSATHFTEDSQFAFRQVTCPLCTLVSGPSFGRGHTNGLRGFFFLFFPFICSNILSLNETLGGAI